MKKKILAIVLAAVTLVNLAPATTEAKAARTYKVRGTVRNFSYAMQYEDGEKLTGRGFDIYTADGNIWEMSDTDTDLHFKDGQKVIVKINDNGTPKDKTDDFIVAVKKVKQILGRYFSAFLRVSGDFVPVRFRRRGFRENWFSRAH